MLKCQWHLGSSRFSKVWGTLTIMQGTANLEAMRAAEAILEQKGILVIFPEGHAQTTLGGPLSGAAYITTAFPSFRLVHTAQR